MSDAFRRAARTFFQAFVGVLAVQGGALLTDIDDGQIDWSMWQRVGLSALAAGVIALVTFIQNWLEDNVDAVPAIGK